LKDFVKLCFTRRLRIKSGSKTHVITLVPNGVLLLGVKFAIFCIALLFSLEIFHIFYFGAWNSEIFTGIMGLAGLVIGAFFGQAGIENLKWKKAETPQ
jgi:hypothetical protein